MDLTQDTAEQTATEQEQEQEPATTVDGILEEREAARQQQVQDARDSGADDQSGADDLDEEITAESGDQTQSDDGDEPSEASDIVESEGEADDEPPIAASPFWSDEFKEHWNSLDPVTQKWVTHENGLKEAKFTQAMMEVSQKVASQTAEITTSYQDKLTHLERQVEVAQALVLQEYGLDDMALAQAITNGADVNDIKQYQINREAQKAKVDAVIAELDAQKEKDYQEFLRAESAKLPELAPELIDPNNKQELGQYLTEVGYTNDELKNVDALGLSIAYKAMKWDKAQKKLNAKPKRAPKPPKQVTKPSRGKANSSNPQISKLQERYNKTGSMDDLLALRAAKRQSA